MRRATAVVLGIVVAVVVAYFVFAGDEEQPEVERKKEEPSKRVEAAARGERPRLVTAKPDPDRPRERIRSAPLPLDGEIKVAADGREYVEYIKEDGTRVRDFRRSAREAVAARAPAEKRPRLLAPSNAVRLQREVRPHAWRCMREHWDELVALPEAGDNPAIVVTVKTRLHNGSVSVVEGVARAASGGAAAGLEACMAKAVANLEIPLDPKAEQDEYGEGEVALRFSLPKAPAE